MARRERIEVVLGGVGYREEVWGGVRRLWRKGRKRCEGAKRRLRNQSKELTNENGCSIREDPSLKNDPNRV